MSDQAQHNVQEDEQVPFNVTTSSVQKFEGMRERLAALAVELSHAANDAAMVAATPISAAPAVTVPVTEQPTRVTARRRRQIVHHEQQERTTTMDQATQTAQPNQSNVPSFNDLLAMATDLGTQAGQGKDVQIKFALKVVEAAYLGGLNLDPNKHGTDRRDGIVLAEAYVKAQKTATIFDAKADKSRKLISNLDKCIKLGANPKWGVGEPLSTVNQLITHRQTLRKDPANAKKLDDAFNMLMRYATQQLKRDTLIDGDELKGFAFKKDSEQRTVEDVLESIRKTANNLKAGKINNCSELDNSAHVQAIINACTKRLTEIAKARGGQATP